MKQFSSNVAFALISLAICNTAHAMPILQQQVDEITFLGAAYRDDFWTLTVTGPVTSTVTYTTTPADESGANTFNTATNWASAINADAVLGSFLTAVGPTLPTDVFIKLTANTAGVEFFSSVSVIEARETDFNEDPDLAVFVSTITPAIITSIPEPSTLALLAVGAVSLGTRRRKNN